MSDVNNNLLELSSKYQIIRKSIKKKLVEFKNISVDKYFYEMLFCCMTPQSSARSALKAQLEFERLKYLENKINPKQILYTKEYYIRFHNSKAKYIQQIKLNFTEIKKIIISNISPEAKRDWLVKNVKGLGLKEATHFLRNIGMNGELAILDRHILKCLIKYRVINKIPKSISKKIYLSLEKKFQLFSNKTGISINELDLLFWSEQTGEIIK